MCILTLLMVILLISGYSVYKNNKQNIEYIHQISQFERERKELEFKVSTAISLGRMLTEYDCVKKFAMENAEYDKMDFGNINTISSILSMNQSDFSSLGLNIQIFTKKSEVIIAPMRTYDEEEFEELNGKNKNNIIVLFEDDNLEYSYKMISQMYEQGKTEFVFRRTYSDSNTLYGLISFEDFNTRCLQAEDNTLLFIGGNFSDENYGNLGLHDMVEGVVYDDAVKDNERVLYGTFENHTNMVYVNQYISQNDSLLHVLFVLLLIVGILVCIFVSYYITKIMYKPIASLVNIFGGDVSPNYHDEFAFLTEEVHKSLDMNTDLMRELDDVKRERKYKFLFDLINGFVWGDGIYNFIEKYNLSILCNSCNVVMFEFRTGNFNSLSDGFTVFENHVSVLRAELEKVLKNKDSEEWVDGENRVICIIPAIDNINDEINTIVDRLNCLGIYIVAAVSKKIEDPQDYRNIYGTLMNLLKYSYVVGKSVLIEGCDENYSLWNYYTVEQESQLEEFIMNGQYEKALFILRKILMDFKYDKDLKDEDIHKFEMIIVLNTIRFLKQSGLKLLDIEERLSILRDDKTLKRDVFTEEIIDIYKIIIKSFEANVKNNTNHMGEQIIEYIKQNYTKDISMDDICDKFHVSASTITRKLDEAFGIKFKIYLTELRIEKAKKIIQANPMCKIKDIAEMVGFNNTLSFGRAFKRVEGVNVGDYIKKIIK